MNIIKVLRVKKDFSQNKLAEIAGISQSTLSDIERGRTSPTIKILRKIAVALDVSLVALVKSEEKSAS